jgi:hypothetical protein
LRAVANGSNARLVTERVRSQNMRDWSVRRQAEPSRMKGRQNGLGSNDAAYPCEYGRPSGKFLAKLVPLMETFSRFARE